MKKIVALLVVLLMSCLQAAWPQSVATLAQSTQTGLLITPALVVTQVGVGSAQLNYTAPPLNTDGTAIPATGPGSISSFVINYGICANNQVPSSPTVLTIPAPSSTTIINGLAPGTWCFNVAATNTFGTTGQASAAVNKVIAVPVPGQVTNVTIAQNIIFQPVGTRDTGLVMLEVGSVPPTTIPDPLNYIVSQGKTYCHVDPNTKDITWLNASTTPQAIFAVCS